MTPKSGTLGASGSFRDQSGFTLIELVIVLAIIVILSGILFTAMLMTTRSVEINNSKVITQDNARNAMMVIVRELRQANAATLVEEANGSLTYRVVQDTDGNGWPIDAAGNPQYSAFRNIGLDVDDVNGDSLTTSQVVRTEVGSAPVVLANFAAPVDGISFDLSGDTGVQIQIDLQDNSGPAGTGVTMTSSLTETVTPRN